MSEVRELDNLISVLRARYRDALPGYRLSVRLEGESVRLYWFNDETKEWFHAMFPVPEKWVHMGHFLRDELGKLDQLLEAEAPVTKKRLLMARELVESKKRREQRRHSLMAKRVRAGVWGR